MSLTAPTLTPETSRPGSIVGTPEPPILDQSHLKPGHKASLLSHAQTLELYRQNAKKTNDPELQLEFAAFIIDASDAMTEDSKQKEELLKEGISLVKKLADRGHAESQYYLGDCYARGIGTSKSKPDFDKAFPLFVQASKHSQPEEACRAAAYRAAMCYEHGWGCRKDAAKALKFYRKAAPGHAGAMYRLGLAELRGELGLSKNPRDGCKWLKRSADAADEEFPHALYELAELHERGLENTLFVDIEYAVQLLVRAAELNYAPAAFKLGECYEYGKMGCPQDAALSIHYYTIAAQQNHREACFALAAWYLVGSPGVLPQSDAEAYLWAKRAAEQGLPKAEYAVGYFTEVGIGAKKDQLDANVWYRRAAEHGDKRAQQRLKGVPIDEKTPRRLSAEGRVPILTSITQPPLIYRPIYEVGPGDWPYEVTENLLLERGYGKINSSIPYTPTTAYENTPATRPLLKSGTISRNNTHKSIQSNKSNIIKKTRAALIFSRINTNNSAVATDGSKTSGSSIHTPVTPLTPTDLQAEKRPHEVIIPIEPTKRIDNKKLQGHSRSDSNDKRDSKSSEGSSLPSLPSWAYRFYTSDSADIQPDASTSRAGAEMEEQSRRLQENKNNDGLQPKRQPSQPSRKSMRSFLTPSQRQSSSNENRQRLPYRRTLIIEKEPFISCPVGSIFFLFGFLLPPLWWIGSIFPRHVQYKVERRWRRYNRIMSFISLFLIILIFGMAIWYWTSYTSPTLEEEG
ncbi:11817_t:CDS:2 [Ambispora gerdemannii]|uniref:11817_t:CDS:1 n=1 Tax=Ambispora gerdemannii TaxID=144530 RepID=A0A9N9FU33_9GLOM|nr:11817_t:CDS:2 [Ambispora gerdemannii]